jgi:hypothetical protein
MVFSWSNIKLNKKTNTFETLPLIKYLKHVEDVNTVDKTFLLYDNSVTKNLLIIGACRNVQLAFYFNNLNITHLKRNIYFIYAPVWGTEEKRASLPYDVIHKILVNTDIMICESIQNYGVLNTYRGLEKNFFKEFGVKDKIVIDIPNIELRMFHYENVQIFKQPIDQVTTFFQSSKKHVLTKLNEFGYSVVSEFIERNLTKTKLFNTFNHPRRVVMLLLFKCMMAKIGIHLASNFFTEMNKYPFLEGFELPIIHKDIDSYGLQFKCNVSPDTVINVPNVSVSHPIDDYLFVDSDEFIKF